MAQLMHATESSPLQIAFDARLQRARQIASQLMVVRTAQFPERGLSLSEAQHLATSAAFLALNAT